MFGKFPDGPSSLHEQLDELYRDKNDKTPENTSDETLNTIKASSDKAFADKVAADRLAANKMAAEADHLNQVKIINELFFQLMMEALRSSDVKGNLEHATIQVGFTSVADALNKIVNNEGQSPLQYLIQKQDFSGARALMDNGAILGPVEEAVFELARDSKAAREYGLPEPSPSEQLHTVKYFGLFLGIEMTSKDGVTFSQYAHIAPTYQLMTDNVNRHAQKNPENQDFRELADAFSFSNKSAAFSNSTSQRNPAAGQELSDRIQSGKLTTIPISCEGHAMGLSIVPDGPGSKSGYLVYTNKGLGAKPAEYGTQIYRLDDVSKANPQFINNMMNGFHNGTPHDEIKRQIAQVTEGKDPIHVIRQKGQKVDNCTIANSGANVHGILLCQQAVKKGGFDKLDGQDMAYARDEYKQFKADMKADKVKELAEAIKKNPGDSDLINLGKGFLNKKNADPDLKSQLELALGSKMLRDTPSTQSQTELKI
ncbi:Dot/Icm T4SS effector AnkD/LegA15 [Legionella quateirensis]|uniref:Dot/Icm secretion system substrate n=1 Tax=Legionella quateirensis TaxID=45072 RepID=A0A378KTS4_9GAMM|nr:Dot/Icm T4SS effector AnkD/LegA15 [Legionella quateirensis]KTD50793.1 substrate of the Dot/Icm secretion system [Legionella quateirensis]STY17962.1 Dot/Icm secretion system substrate [Legionella quateirensis]